MNFILDVIEKFLSLKISNHIIHISINLLGNKERLPEAPEAPLVDPVVRLLRMAGHWEPARAAISLSSEKPAVVFLDVLRLLRKEILKKTVFCYFLFYIDFLEREFLK